MYKTQPNFSRANQEIKKTSINIKRDEINTMKIINDSIFNLLNSFLNNEIGTWKLL